MILLKGFDSLDFSYSSRYLDKSYNWIDINATLSSSLIKTWNVLSDEDCAKSLISVDLNVTKLISKSNNELMIVILSFIKIELFVNFWINQPLLRVFKKRRKICFCWEMSERDDWYLLNVNWKDFELSFEKDCV